MKSMMKKSKWFASPLWSLAMMIVMLGMAVSFVGPAFAVTTPYVQRFDSGSMPGSPWWSYYSSNSHGRIQVRNGRLRMDAKAYGNYVLNEAVLTIDLAGRQDVVLNFFHKAFPLMEDVIAFSAGNANAYALKSDGSLWYFKAVVALSQNFILDFSNSNI